MMRPADAARFSFSAAAALCVCVCIRVLDNADRAFYKLLYTFRRED